MHPCIFSHRLISISSLDIFMNPTNWMDEPPQLLLRMEQNSPTLSDQQRRVLTLLQSKEWVTLPEILDLRIASYTRRISELRELGHPIECETEWIGGIRHSKYHLVRT